MGIAASHLIIADRFLSRPPGWFPPQLRQYSSRCLL